MQKSLINYLILPKGFRSILFKSYVYFVPFFYFLTIDVSYAHNFLLFVVIFILFELVINPFRYQLNDIVDYKEDRQRHYHWQRPVGRDDKILVLIVALSRFVIGTTIVFLLDIKLGFLAIIFLILQFFYDYYAKKTSPFLAVFVVSMAYPLRSLTIFYGLDVELGAEGVLVLLSVLFYSSYMVIQWRKHESLFITKNKLLPKPHSEFFGSYKINFLSFFVLVLFFIVFIPLVVILMKIEPKSTVVIYGMSGFIMVVFFLLSKEIIKQTAAQSHNIFILSLFVIFTLDKLLISLFISVVTIFLFVWYHRIYVDEFANHYFNESHYEKV